MARMHVYTTVQKFLQYFTRLGVYSFYRFCWMCVNLLDCIVNSFFFKSHQPGIKSANFGRVIWRQKIYNMRRVSPYDFICLFSNQVKPEYVLQSNVSLYAMTDKNAIFVETAANVNIYSSDVHPFFFVAQFLNATKVIKMSIEDFVTLADKLGDPKVPVIWMSNTGRCGGTMLCQVIETVPDTLVINEPDSPSNILHLYQANRINVLKYDSILRCMIRVICMPRPGITRIFIKPRALCTFMITDICKVCPDVRHIFIYRNSLDTIKSWLSVMAFEPYLVVIRAFIDVVWLSNIFPFYRNVIRLHFTSKRQEGIDMPVELTTISMIATFWANQILFVRKKLALDQISVSLKNEDIISRPKETVNLIFAEIGIDTIHAELAVGSLKHDSQRGSPLSRENIGGARFRFMSETDRVNCDAILSKRNLPALGHTMARFQKTLESFFKYFIRLAAYSLYRFCWMFMNVLDNITNAYVSKTHQPTTKSAKLGRILWRQKFYNMRHASPYDFICLNVTHVTPEYVLQPNVSLYSITTNEAIFVETSADVNIYSSDLHPFFFVAQFLNATTVVKMPIKDFLRLADKLGDPKIPVLWVSNTGRCGGTMLCQVFETVPGMLVINEPDIPTNIHQLCATNKILNSEYKIMLRSIIRVLFKQRPGITRICVKPRPMCSAMMLDISMLDINVTQIFMYRNCFDTIKSVLAVMSQDPEYDVTRVLVDTVWFSKLCPYFKNLLIYRFAPGIKTVIDVPPNPTTACIFTCNWVNQVLIAREAVARDKLIIPIRYEDISTRPLEVVAEIFDRLGIDAHHIDRAIASLDRDSQRGSVLSRNNVEDASNRYMSAMDRSRSDGILLNNNLPRMGEDFRL